MVLVTAREGWSLRGVQSPPAAGASARMRLASPCSWLLHGGVIFEVSPKPFGCGYIGQGETGHFPMTVVVAW